MRKDKIDSQLTMMQNELKSLNTSMSYQANLDRVITLCIKHISFIQKIPLPVGPL